MANPYRGEVVLELDGEPRLLRLSLGILAELEVALEAGSLMELVTRFEEGTFRARDLIHLLRAGLKGGGLEMTEAEFLNATIEGGPVEAARIGAELLRLTFSLPEDA